MINITLPDGTVTEFPEGITPIKIAESISEGLARTTVAAKSGDTWLRLDEPLNEDMPLRLITERDEEGLEPLRHTAAHVLAQAVKRLFPDVVLGFGPDIETGFYYDFLVKDPFNPDDLKSIEDEMRKIIDEDIPITYAEVDKQTCLARLKDLGETLKVDHVPLMEDEIFGLYSHGDFTDLCAGPHLPSTGKLKYFQLLSTGGAYWKGDERNPMLQRIYGTAFFNKKALKEFLKELEEVKKRDHRIVGKELGLYALFEEGGAGMPVYLPKGAMIRRLLLEFEEAEHLRRGYEILSTPHVFPATLWETSGHLENYRDNMFLFEIDEKPYGIKPMNCPGHVLVYKNALRSYRDLPQRYFEFGQVYRYERSGALTGLARVRSFTIDDGHIFCTPDQMVDELVDVIDFCLYFWETLGFEPYAKLATRPEKALGDQEQWDFAIEQLKQACARKELDYKMDIGGGAFYGPKIDLFIKDAFKREWQGSTIQLDFNLPERFDLHYVDEKGERVRPVMIHRAVMGSFERFFGVFIEHTGGNFPLWLAPEQARILPITDRVHEYCDQVKQKLESEGMRVSVDKRSEKIGYKIREGELQKIPYLLIAGDKEVENGNLALRVRKEGDKGAIGVDEFVDSVREDLLIPRSDRPKHK
jgi:threonyl-tRNA synthetase